MRIEVAQLCPYQLAYRRPWHAVSGPQIIRHGWHLRLRSNCGRVGWGEMVTWPHFGPNNQQLAAAAASLPDKLLGQTLPETAQLSAWLLERLGPAPLSAVLFAAEAAILDILAQVANTSVAQLLHPQPQEKVALAALVLDAQEVTAAVMAGVACLKCKVGGPNWPEELARLHIFRQLAEAAAAKQDLPPLRWRLDANGSWSLPQALQALESLQGWPLDCIEQPLPNLRGWQQLQAFGVPLAADEMLLDTDLDTILAQVEVVIIKPMFVGGMYQSLQIAARAHRTGVRAIVTHAMDSDVGRMAAAHVAAALPTSSDYHGLSPVLLPFGEVASSMCQYGHLPISGCCGLFLPQSRQNAPF